MVTTIPEKWPVSHNAIGVNEWNKDVALFCSIVQENPNFWHMDHGIKYLNIRVDTRNGCFVLLDEKRENRISPDRVLKAIKEHKEFMK